MKKCILAILVLVILSGTASAGYYINVTSDPPNAYVLINGTNYPNLTNSSYEVDAGFYIVKTKKNGYESNTTHVTVIDQNITIDIVLSNQKKVIELGLLPTLFLNTDGSTSVFNDDAALNGRIQLWYDYYAEKIAEGDELVIAFDSGMDAIYKYDANLSTDFPYYNSINAQTDIRSTATMNYGNLKEVVRQLKCEGRKRGLDVKVFYAHEASEELEGTIPASA